MTSHHHMLGKGTEGVTRPPLSGCLFEPCRLSAWPEGTVAYSTLAYAAPSGKGQENRTEVPLHLPYGEEQGVHLSL